MLPSERDDGICVGRIPPFVRRVICPPSLLATHRSSLPPSPARKATLLPSLEIAASLAGELVGMVTRRWMSSQSMSLVAGAPGTAGRCNDKTHRFEVLRRLWLMKASLLPA